MDFSPIAFLGTNTDAVSQSLDQLSTLLDTVFATPENHHFLDDFPIWNPRFQQAMIEHWGIFEHQKLVSSAGLRVADLKTSPTSSVRIGLIGAVGTLPAYRGRGLATQVVQQTIQSAEAKNASVVLLWSNEPSFYRRLGFDLCGQQLRVPLGRIVKEESISSSISSSGSFEIREGWVPEIFASMQDRSGGLVLNRSDLLWMAAHKNVKWFYVKDRNQVQAYAALGRGIDLTDLVHEWGGESQAIRRILAYIYLKYPTTALLGSPSLFRERGFPFQEDEIEYLCFGKILNASSLFRSFYPYQSVRLGPAGGRWRIELENQKRFELSHQELLHFILGPSALNPDLPFWIWGLDSA